MNGRERLAVLEAALRANAANPKGMKFDLDGWFGGEDSIAGTLMTMKPDCGTIGCAVGLACLLPQFQAEGLEVGS